MEGGRGGERRQDRRVRRGLEARGVEAAPGEGGARRGEALHVAVVEGTAYLRVDGRANFIVGVDFKTIFESLIGKGYRRFAIDLRDCPIMDSTFNIFFKLHYQKTYEGILATPMRVPDVAFGEMVWALGRGSLYAAAFLATVK